MRHLTSRLATIVAAGAIVVFGGGVAAQASGLIDGGDILNGSITSRDLANGGVKSADLGDNSVKASDLAPNSVDEAAVQDGAVADGLSSDLEAMTDEEVQTLKAGGGLDTNGSSAYAWKGDPTTGSMPAMPMVPSALMTMNVSGVDSPTTVTLQVGDTQVTCVAGPVGEGENAIPGTCSAFAQVSGGVVTRVETGGDTQVTVELVGVQTN